MLLNMIIHLGNDIYITKNDIIGIFDLDNSTVSKHTRNYLKKAQDRDEIITINSELPKSFILTSKNKKNNIYLSQLASSTLLKRYNNYLKF